MTSLKSLARKILGRRGTFLLRNTLSTISFHLGIVKPPTTYRREEGISAMVCTCNEADWIEPSLLSIKDLVDEYVVVDSSIDDTPKIIKLLRDNHGLNIKVTKVPPGSLVEARNLALKLARYKWILHWDADFIAKPELTKVIIDVLNSLDKRFHYLIYWPHVALCGDLMHLCPNPIHIEHWLFTWSPHLKYVWLDHLDHLHAPIHMYKAIIINKVLSLHLARVRNPTRIAIKTLWWRFRKEFNKVKSWEEFLELAKRKALEVFGTDDLEAIGKELIKKHVSRLRRYDKNAYGDYPPILKEYVKRKYGMIL